MEQRLARLRKWQSDEAGGTPPANDKPLALPARKTLVDLERIVQTENKLMVFAAELNRRDGRGCVLTDRHLLLDRCPCHLARPVPTTRAHVLTLPYGTEYSCSRLFQPATAPTSEATEAEQSILSKLVRGLAPITPAVATVEEADWLANPMCASVNDLSWAGAPLRCPRCTTHAVG